MRRRLKGMQAVVLQRVTPGRTEEYCGKVWKLHGHE